MIEEKLYYANRYHPQRNLSEANVRLYNTILDLDVETIFEFGCGVGRHLEKLKDWGYTVTGMDISEQCVDEAKILGLNVLHGDESMLHHIKPKDLVFTNTVLCHMNEKDALVAQKLLRRIASKYLITCECVSKTNNFWWVHEYKGKSLYTIDSHLNNGAIYEMKLLTIK